jgi:nitrite reductase/ring-hydroxylating ferredoxin subunit
MSDVQYHAVAKTGDLAPGEVKQIILGKREIALYNLEGEFYATDDICTHAYASLSDGYFEGDEIECPLHGGAFKVKTGEAIRTPCTENLDTFPVKVEGDDILIGVPAD